MKKLLVVIAVLASLQSIAQWPWEKVEGNGQLKKENRNTGNYTSIASSGSWDVMIAYGESNSLQVEADENLLPYIETQVENGRLSIKSKKNANLRSKNKITIYVSVTKLTGVSLSGSGDIIGNGKFDNDGNTSFKLSGSGSIKIAFNKIAKTEVTISGSGNVRLSGTSGSVAAHISGSGNADCSELNCDEVKASISGSGNVKVNANRSIEASIAGSGNVYYKGAATDIQKHVSGSGRVVKS